MQPAQETRDHWGSRIGFVMAAAGSAVGLGNIWKFPYIAGEHGGGAFILIYLALVFSVGIAVMLAELAIGRLSQRNPVGAFTRLKGGKWILVGYAGVAAAFLILPFYSVVGGWTIAYVVKTATGALATTDPAVLGRSFNAFTADPVEPILWHALFMALTVAVVIGGVGRGIERSCRILFPILVLILVALVVRALTLPGAEKGIAFYLTPDFSRVGAGTIAAALSQVFFSLGLGMGAMITYGSYIGTRGSLVAGGWWVTLLDTFIALLAGLAVLPAVFAFGLNPGEGPGLSFITLPAVFGRMPAGVIFGVLFFLLLVIAALTSALSLLEVVVAYLVDERRMERTPATLLAAAVMFLIGVPASLSFGPLSEATLFGLTTFEFLDYVSTRLLLPAGAIFIALFVAWVVWPRTAAEITPEGGVRPRWAGSWRMLCGVVAPVVIGWILVSGL